MYSGTETCLCCITMFCQSNSSNVTDSSPNVKGIARLEHMVHNLMKKAGIKPSIKAMPAKAVKNPSIYKKLVPSWFSFKDWDTMEDADVFFNSNLKSLVTLNWKRFLLAIEISWENVHFLFLFFTRTNLALMKQWRICQRRWTSSPKISSLTLLHTLSADLRTAGPWPVYWLTYFILQIRLPWCRGWQRPVQMWCGASERLSVPRPGDDVSGKYLYLLFDKNLQTYSIKT